MADSLPQSLLFSHQGPHVTFSLAEALWPAAFTGCHSLLAGPGPGLCLFWSLFTVHPQLVQFQCLGQNILSPPVSHCILAKPWFARYFIHCPYAFSNRMLHNSPTSHLLLGWTVAHLWQHHNPLRHASSLPIESYSYWKAHISSQFRFLSNWLTFHYAQILSLDYIISPWFSWHWVQQSGFGSCTLVDLWHQDQKIL